MSTQSPRRCAGGAGRPRVAPARPVVALLVLALVGAGCSFSRNPLTGKKRAYAWSWEQERELGAQADEQVVAQFGVYEDPELQRYVERVGQQVLAESHLRRPDTAEEFRNTPFTFRVLDSEVVNAFALPGGYVYVTRGLLAHMENEAQLAMVLGHEIGHVAGRHAAERAFEQQMGQLGLIGGAILGQEVLGIPGQDILNLGGVAAQLLFLRYSRDDERESDELGVEYAAKAGYAAGEGAEFFRVLDRISQQQGQAVPSFLSTHPDPGDREERIPELASAWEQKLSTSMDEVGTEALQRHLDGVVAGKDPRQGFVEGGVFHHPTLRFRFAVPPGWQTVNQASQVVMVEENQKAVIGFQGAPGRSAEEAARRFASQEGLQVLDTGRSVAGGLPASYVLVAAQTQQQQVVQALTTFIEYEGRVWSFIGYTTRDAFDQYDQTFSQVMGSFAPERDPAVLQVQPHRLEVVEAPRTAPFRSLLPSRLPEGFTAQDLAILNQMELDETVRAGTLIKRVR